MRMSDANEESGVGALEISKSKSVRAPQLCFENLGTTRRVPQPDLYRAHLLRSCGLFFYCAGCHSVNAAAYMWRSNVPRLRKRSSAVLWHTARPKSSLSGLPITDVEFREALRSVGGLEPFDGHPPHRRRPLGRCSLNLAHCNR